MLVRSFQMHQLAALHFQPITSNLTYVCPYLGNHWELEVAKNIFVISANHQYIDFEGLSVVLVGRRREIRLIVGVRTRILVRHCPT